MPTLRANSPPSGLQERDAYLPLADSASKMYFIISDLSKINNMYRFSLAAFLRLFQRALRNKQVRRPYPIVGSG